MYSHYRVDALPNDENLAMSKLKTFADGKSKVTQNITIVFRRIESIVGLNGENAGHQHFLLFSHCFQNTSLSRSLKVGIVLYKVK